MLRIIMTAMLAFGAGAGATYGTLRLAVTCPAVAVASDPAGDDVKHFLSQPDQPLTGYQRY